MKKNVLLGGCAVITVVMAASCAPAEETDAGPSCTYPEAGECDGDTLNFCNADGEDETIDCAGYDVAATCGEVNADWGNDCIVASGDECEASSGADEVIALPCAGTEPGCLDNDDNAGTWMCTDNAGTCTGTEDNECVGDTFVYACIADSQPWGVDCASYGGTCGEANGNTGCQMATGGFCDDVDLFCSDGSTCGADFLCP